MGVGPYSARTEPRFPEEAVNKLAKGLPLDGAELGPSVIRNLPPAKHTPIQRDAHSHMGSLSTFPAKILSVILDSLDFQSLSRLSQTCLLARNVIEQHPAYNDMMSCAPETLTALKKTGLLTYHSASQLRRVLHSEKCVSCTNFGGYLFLPTCERACFDCLNYNYSLRVTTLAVASRCFRLSYRQLRRAPIMHSIPGMYGIVRHILRYSWGDRLVSVRQAKELAIKVHGSAQALQALQPKLYRELEPTTRMNNLLMKHFREVPLEPSEPPFDTGRFDPRILWDDYGGTAVIRFPALENGELDFGTLCLGCRATLSAFEYSNISKEVVSELYPAFADAHTCFALESITVRLWSKTGFPQHIKECYGVKNLLEA